MLHYIVFYQWLKIPVVYLVFSIYLFCHMLTVCFARFITEGACRWFEWRCDDGGCVDERLKCNDRADCADGSDERGCSSK